MRQREIVHGPLVTRSFLSAIVIGSHVKLPQAVTENVEVTVILRMDDLLLQNPEIRSTISTVY